MQRTPFSMLRAHPGRGMTESVLLSWVLDVARPYFPSHDYRTFAIGTRTQQKRQRRPSLKTVLDQAKKAGATTVTTPEGVTVAFGQQSANSEANPWDKVLSDAANKKRLA